MSKKTKEVITLLVVDILLLAAIISLIVFVVSQAKSNNKGEKPNPTPQVHRPVSGSPTPTPTSEPSATPSESVTPEPTEPGLTPTEAATPTPEPTAAPTPTEAPSVQANGAINANILNIRVDAGTEFDKVTLDGNPVQLTDGHKVQILDIKGSWYHVRFEYKNTILEGYAFGPYVKPNADSGFKQITN